MERRDVMKELSPQPVTSPGPGKGKSWTAKFRRKTDELQQEKKKQLQDYTAWVNNYLKRKPGLTLVTDLRANLQDGITLINLIEIVAHVQLDGINRYPNSSNSRRHNVDMVMEFLRLEGVVLQGDPTKDILDGNSKGIMRVILAVAERYQPRSVKQRSSSDAKQYQRERDDARDHMTYTLHTDSNVLKRSQSPEGTLRAGIGSSVTNSFSVPNMASMNVHAGTSSSAPSGKASVARSGSASYRYFADHRLSTSPTYLTHSPSFTNSPGLAMPPSTGFGVPPATGYAPPTSSMTGQPPPPIPPKPFQFSSPRTGHPSGPSPQTRTAAERDDTYAIPADTLPPSARARVIQPMKKQGPSRHHHPSHITIRSVPEDHRARSQSSPVRGAVYARAESPGLLNHEMNEVLSGLEEFKSELMRLHSLLVQNSGGEGGDSVSKNLEQDLQFAPEDSRTSEDCNTTPTPPGKESPLFGTATPTGERQGEGGASEQTASLQHELHRLQDEFTEKESECVTLRNMLEERNTYITTMKSEIYRKEYRNDTQKVDLQSQILQKDAVVKKLEEDLAAIRDTMGSKESEVEELSAELESKIETESRLQQELEGAREEVSRLLESEEALLGRVATRDRKVGHLEEKIAEMQEARVKRADSISDDVDGIRRRLNQLRAGYSPQDGQQQVIDQLEQHISEMTSQLVERSTSPAGKRSRRHRDSEDHHRERGDRERGDKGGDRERDTRGDREKERRKRHKERQHSTHSATSDGKAEPTTPISLTGDITKVFYYILNDKNESPYVTQVPGKSNEITLRHFKSAFDRPGVFRFYFKTEDPDCGIVKEEITDDDQILPNWKGKILVWVTEKK